MTFWEWVVLLWTKNTTRKPTNKRRQHTTGKQSKPRWDLLIACPRRRCWVCMPKTSFICGRKRTITGINHQNVMCPTSPMLTTCGVNWWCYRRNRRLEGLSNTSSYISSSSGKHDICDICTGTGGTGTVPVQYPGTVYYFKKHVATQALVPSTQSVITTLTTGTYVPPSLYLFQFSGTGTSTAPPRYVWYTCTPLCLFFHPLILMIRRTYEDRTQNPFSLPLLAAALLLLVVWFVTGV